MVLRSLSKFYQNNYHLLNTIKTNSWDVITATIETLLFPLFVKQKKKIIKHRCFNPTTFEFIPHLKFFFLFTRNYLLLCVVWAVMYLQQTQTNNKQKREHALNVISYFCDVKNSAFLKGTPVNHWSLRNSVSLCTFFIRLGLCSGLTVHANSRILSGDGEGEVEPKPTN